MTRRHDSYYLAFRAHALHLYDETQVDTDLDCFALQSTPLGGFAGQQH